jgi:hypothetical protein
LIDKNKPYMLNLEIHQFTNITVIQCKIIYKYWGEQNSSLNKDKLLNDPEKTTCLLEVRMVFTFGGKQINGDWIQLLRWVPKRQVHFALSLAAC